MKKGILLYLVLLLPLFSVQAAQLQAMNFYQEGDVSVLELAFDTTEIKAHKFHITDDKQIIVDLENVHATKRVLRAFDTSEFSGALVFVDAYPKPGNPKDLRVSLQLRDNVRAILKNKSGKLRIEVENHFGAFTQRKLDLNKNQLTANKDDGETTKLHIPKSDSVEDILENLTLSGRKKYIGKRISFNFRDVPVEDVLHMIANASGFNIILNKSIKSLQTMSLALTNIPWDQALDTILGLNKLVATKNGNILLVTTLEEATRVKKLEIRAKKIAADQEPLVTKVFPISYSSLKEMKNILKDYLTPGRGKISADNRTNSFIVKDKVEVIEKLKKIIELLDTQTPQISIESKIVEVLESYEKRIGLSNGVNFGYDPLGSKGSGTTTVGAGGKVSSDTFEFGPGFSLSSAAFRDEDSIGKFASLSIGRFGRIFNLNFNLELLETETKGKVVASPKVITQNKQTAKITTIDQTSYIVTRGTGADTEKSYEQVNAQLSLEVTPQVTNDGSIVLDVAVKKEQFIPLPGDGPPDKNTREISTNVLVENGSTIVIGGVYNYKKDETKYGVPFLKDIPILGWLFRGPETPKVKKNELIIFLTPRIINQEKAGLSDRS